MNSLQLTRSILQVQNNESQLRQKLGGKRVRVFLHKTTPYTFEKIYTLTRIIRQVCDKLRQYFFHHCTYHSHSSECCAMMRCNNCLKLEVRALPGHLILNTYVHVY